MACSSIIFGLFHVDKKNFWLVNIYIVFDKDMDKLTACHIQRLQWSLQALARPARKQL